MTVQPHVYRPVILELQRECRTAAGDVNVFWINVDAEFVSSLNDIYSQPFRIFPIRDGKRNFLVNEIVVLKSCKVGRAILGRGKENQDQYD